MSKVLIRLAAVAGAAALGATLLTGTASSQTAEARGQMERCVDRVLARIARNKVPEAQVGRAVISECDGSLRATLASAIKTGDALFCSVDSCIEMARDRAAQEATLAYRERLARSPSRSH
jgi:hypothetical protein